MNRTNIFQRYLFRKDFFWKIQEKILWFIRNNSRDAYKDQRALLKNVKNGNIFDVGAYIGNTVKLYRNYFPGYKIFCFEPFIDSYYHLNNRFSDDSNISINLVPKGTGSVQANGSPLSTVGKAVAMAMVFG